MTGGTNLDVNVYEESTTQFAGTTWVINPGYKIAYRSDYTREDRHSSGRHCTSDNGLVIETARFWSNDRLKCMISFYSALCGTAVWIPIYSSESKRMLDLSNFVNHTDQGQESQWRVIGKFSIAYRFHSKRESRDNNNSISRESGEITEVSRVWSSKKKECMIEFHSGRLNRNMWLPVYHTDGRRMLQCTKYEWQNEGGSLVTYGKGSQWKIVGDKPIKYRSDPNRNPKMHWSHRSLTSQTLPVTEKLRFWSGNKSNCMIGFHSTNCEEICWVPVYHPNGHRILQCVVEKFTNPLTIENVRRVARFADAKEIVHKVNEKLLSFSLRNNNDVRINVYYTTGTVGTCIDHPHQGKTQLFRRCVTVQILKQIFDNPRIHTDKGYKRKRDNVRDDEQVVLQKHLKRLRKEAETVEILLNESKLRKKQEEQERKEQERKEQERKDQARAYDKAMKLQRIREKRGKFGSWETSHTKDVKSMFTTECISLGTNGASSIFLYENGNWAYTSGLPNLLYNKLKGRQRHLPSPEYVALGTHGRYYISFADGKSEWSGPDEMTKAINNSGCNSVIKSISFGGNYGDYFIVFKCGRYCYSGVPIKFHNILNSNHDKQIETAAIGPNGSYYLKLNNGISWWSGIPTGVTNAIDKQHGTITFVDFGADGNFFVRYR